MLLKRIITSALLLAGAWVGVQAAPLILSSSITGGTEDPTQTAALATDNDYLTALRINTTDATVSFVVDLGAVTTVTSVAMYGDPQYRASIGMFSDTVTVSAGSSDTGPFTQIGSITVGNTRPTDPNPAVGGENPWTGGNGRLIPTATTATRYLKIEGGAAYDNIIDVYALFINPKAVIHTIDPVYNGVSMQPFDFGGGPDNSRASIDMIDGKYNTRTFLGVVSKLTLDFGTPKTIRGMRFQPSDNDAPNVPKTGVIRVSSTDVPSNMDTTAMNFSVTGIGGSQIASPQVTLPSDVTKRYMQIQFDTNQAGAVPDGTNPTFRLSEIDFLTPDNSCVRNPIVVPGSVTGATVAVDPEGVDKITDRDYLTRGVMSQDSGATELTFVVDLGQIEKVRSVVMYGNWQYQSGINMLSDDIKVEAGSTASGPFTQIGLRNVGNVRPTDPNPAVGGENPWTGGNGRLIPTTPTDTRYLRISGGFGYDNAIALNELIVNPPGSLHRIADPAGAVDQGQTIYDAGGGQPFNSRVGPDVFDGLTISRQNPRVAVNYTLDLGVAEQISMLRITAMDNDIGVLPNNITLKASSNNDPNNLDVTLASNAAAPLIGGQKILTVTDTGSYRYLRLDVADPGNFRIGEIIVDPVEHISGGTGPEPTPTPGPTASRHWTLF